MPEKHILTAQVEGKDWKLTIPIMLLNYRNTPHRMTGKTPSFLLMNREIKTKIPSIPRQPNQGTDVQKKDKVFHLREICDYCLLQNIPIHLKL